MERREEIEEETQAPMRVVPTRRMIPTSQLETLRQEYNRVQGLIDETRDYALQMTVTPSEATREFIGSQANELEETLERLRLASIPVVGGRYENEIDLLRKDISRARKAGEKGELGEAVKILDQTAGRMERFGDVFEIELGILMAGVPSNVRVAGMAPEEAVDAVLESMESALLDIGTMNYARAEIILEAGRLYAENAQHYNKDDPTIRKERDALFGFIIERGNQAKAGIKYTATQEKDDRELLQTFEENLESIKGQTREYNIEVLDGWRTEIDWLITQERRELIKKQLEELRTNVDLVIKKLQKESEVSEDEMQSLMTRYYMFTGKKVPVSEEEHLDNLIGAAKDLRGTRRKVEESSAEWFGEQALTALNEENRRLAALAIAAGMLSRSAAKLDRHPSYYLGATYWEVFDIIKEKRPATPAMLNRIAIQMDVALLIVEADLMQKKYSKGPKKTKTQRDRVVRAVETLNNRIVLGNLEGAKRLLGMLSDYTQLIDLYKGKDWPGSAEMGKAIDAEIGGKDASRDFNTALLQYQFTEESEDFRTSIKDWKGKALEPQRVVVDHTLNYMARLAKQGKREEAREVLTLLVMYVDSVERLAERKKGKVVSLSSENALHVRGMETALRTLATGRKSLAEIEDEFGTSFNKAQAVYVDSEAGRLGRLAEKRPVGRITINAALERAKERAANGDIRGANMLLQYVKGYYGEADAKRREGWRYNQFSDMETPAHKKGQRQMIQAIKMEMEAETETQHLAAAKRFDHGTRTVAELQSYRALQVEHRRLSDIYEGRRAIVPGLKPGTVPMGERSKDGTYPSHLRMKVVRDYEKNNPKDTVIWTGKKEKDRKATLESLLTELDGAARRGDVKRYMELRKAFWNRFALVASRAYRRETISDTREILAQAKAGIQESYRIYVIGEYGEGVYNEARSSLTISGMGEPSAAELNNYIVKKYGSRRGTRIAKLLDAEKRIGKVLEKMDGPVTYGYEVPPIEDTDAAIPLKEIPPILEAVQSESRLALAYGQLKQEINANRAFRKRIGGVRGGLAQDRLTVCNKELEKAIKHLVGGEIKSAEAAYGRAVKEKVSALGMYDAIENPLGTPYDYGYEHYKDLQLNAFSRILDGTAERSEVERMLKGARAIEISVLTIPVNEASQFFSDYTGEQLRVRKQVEAGSLDRAETIVASMQERVKDNKFWTNIGVVGAGIAISLIPGGQFVGGAIFATMAWEHVVTEYQLMGQASMESWGMFGLIVGTMGLAGAASMLHTTAISARAMGATNYAANMMRWTQGLSYATVGIGLGFSGYMGAHAVEAFKAGDTREAVFLAGMALFPVALMGGAGIRARGRAKAARAETETILSEIVAERAVELRVNETPAMRNARALRTPETLFRFLRDFAATDKAGRRVMLEQLPENMQTRINTLMKDGRIKKALKAGRLDDLSFRILEKTITELDIPPRPSGPGGGPRGRKGEVDAAGLLQPGELADLLGGLMTPSKAIAGDTPVARAAAVRKNAAVARLEAIREASPEVANIIDGLVNNPTVMRHIMYNEITPMSQRMISRAQGQIREALPPETIAAEQRAAVGYYEYTYAEEAPRAIRREGAQEIPGMMPEIRAEAGAPPPPRGPGPTTPVEGAPAAGARPPVQEVHNIGKLERLGRAATKRFRGWREKRAEGKKKAELPSAEEVLEQSGRRFEDMLDTIADQKTMDAMIQSANTEADLLAVEATRVRNSGRASADEIAAVEARATQARTDAVELQTAMEASTQKLSDVIKILYKNAQTQKDPKRYWNVLERIYAKENVRLQLERMATTDADLALAISRIGDSIKKAARVAGTSPENYMALRAGERIPQEDIGLIVESIGRRALEVRVEPISVIENYMGMEFSPAERAVLTLRLEDAGIVSPEMLLHLTGNTVTSAKTRIEEIPTGDNPVVELMKNRLAERANEGGNVNEILLGILRSEEVAQAVGKNYDPKAERMFRDAVQKENIREILDSLTADIAPPLETFWNAAQSPELAIEFSAVKMLKPRIDQIIATISDQYGIFAGDTRPLARDAADVAKRIGRFILEWEPVTNWGARRFVGALRNSVAGGRLRAGLRTSPYMIPQLIAWGVMGYYGNKHLFTPAYGRIELATGAAISEASRAKAKGADLGDQVEEGFIAWWNTLTSAGDIELGLAMCQRDFGFACSKRNAMWLSSEEGKEFFFELPNHFPKGPERRPGTINKLAERLESTDFLIDFTRIDEILTDGREMGSELDDVNDLIGGMTTGTAEEKAAAEKELRALFEAWGVAFEDVQELIGQGKTKFDIKDMLNLRINNWRARGLIITFSDVVSTTFCADTFIISEAEVMSGNIGAEGRRAVRYLNENSMVFATLWDAVQKGHIPSIYVRDAITSLIDNNITDTEVFRDHLIEQGLYLTIPIKQNSFLGVLDRRTASDPASRATFRRLLETYQDNPEALAAFNSFNIREVKKDEAGGGEMIYGSPEDLAALIINNPENAVEVAREQGYIGPTVLGEIDARLFEAENIELVRFAVERSDGSQKGIVRWLIDHKNRIGGNAVEILNDMAGSTTAPGVGKYEAAYEYLNRRAEVYVDKGWWEGPTPLKVEEDTGKKPTAPVEHVETGVELLKKKAEMRRGEIRGELKPRYVRRPGFEARAEDIEAATEEALERGEEPMVFGLTAEATEFYEDETRSSVLGPAIDATVDKIIEGKGKYKGDSQRMIDVYGEDLRSEETREAVRDTVREDMRGYIYDLMTTATEPAAEGESKAKRVRRERAQKALSEAGITIVSSPGEPLAVEVDISKARKFMPQRVIDFLNTQTGGK